MLLAKNGEWKTVDLGLVHSSAAPSMSQLIVERLVQAGDVEDKAVSPNFLVRNWPPAFKEWNTKSVRDAFFASPLFPRLLNPDSIKDSIARGVENGMLGYVGKKADGSYTHSMTYTFDNYTNTGILSTLALTKNWMVQLGLTCAVTILGQPTPRKAACRCRGV